MENQDNGNEIIGLTKDQAIDAIYTISNGKREPFEYQKVGNYGFINPKAKSFDSIVAKLIRKTRSKEDIVNKVSDEEILNRYNQHEDELFDKLSDWSRFAIILPNYQTAPVVLANFLEKFGGEVTIHNRNEYKAIHQHTRYKDVNLEFQFHTKDFLELKKATDIFYHTYKDVPMEQNSKIKDEYDKQCKEISDYCLMVYQQSDFEKNVFNLQKVVDAYNFNKLLTQNKAETQEGDKLSHFIMYARKAEMVQRELTGYLPQFLGELDKTNTLPKFLYDIYKTDINTLQQFKTLPQPTELEK